MQCLDGKRIPLNASERAEMQGSIPYWGANGIVDYVDKCLFDEDLVLLGEDGAPFLDRLKDKAFFVSGPIWPNNHIHVLRPKRNVDHRYLTYILNVVDYTDYIEGTTRDKLTQGKMTKIPCVVPGLGEQRAIAAFLDRETAHIDALIARKQRLIELLQEKRTALISHAVTQGLDPNVPMKDSGVEWLREIPAHWEMRPLGSVARLQRGHDLTTSQRVPGAVPVVTSSGISGFHNEVKVKGPGVITGRYGTIGNIYYVEQDFWPMNTTLYVCDFKGNYQRYIYYLLAILPFDAHSDKSAVPGVDRNDLHVLQVVCPPRSEQEAIASFLDREAVKLDAVVAKVNGVIAELREYRTALIAAAVTGQIDVRGVSELPSAQRINEFS